MEGVLRQQEDVGRALAVGPELVSALAEADWDRVASTLHPDLYLRGLTPGKFTAARGPDAVAQAVDIFKLWFFEDEDCLIGVEHCDVRPIGPDGRYKLSYAFKAKSAGMSSWHADWKLDPPPSDADWIVEQETYYDVKDDMIAWMIILLRRLPADRGISAGSPPRSSTFVPRTTGRRHEVKGSCQ
jgi:hypothetical protein